MNDEILTVIKDLLKSRGITYRELAEVADIPLSTLKKTLAGSGDLTLTKLLEICKALDVSLADVAIEADRAKKRPKTFVLPAADQAFLAANLSHYVLFLAIMRGRKTVADLAEHAGMSARLLREYLDELEKRELIRQDSAGNYRVSGEGAFTLPTSTDLYKQSFNSEFMAFARDVANRVVTPAKSKLHLENGSVLCSKETYERFKAAITQLVDEFVPVFLRDKRMQSPDQLERYNYVLCMSQFDWTRAFFDEQK